MADAVASGLVEVPRVIDAVPATERVASLDVYRGIVILTMVFVNYVHLLPGMPPWILHADERPDTYTFPDIVFPGFLMLVGVSIPLAFRGFLRGATPLRTSLWRVLVRSLGLLFLGVVLEFHVSLVPEHTGLSVNAWILAFYVGMLLVWLSYPKAKTARSEAWFSRARIGGALLIVLLLCLFRGPAKPGGGYEWLHTEWWGILGIIGWAYLCTSLLYLLTRGKDLALLGLTSVMIALYVGARHGRLDFLGQAINGFVGIGEVFGSSSALVMLGALIGNRFVEREEPGARLRFMLWVAAGAYVSGVLLRPMHGYSKIAATESWVLVMGGIHAALLAVCYYLVDVRGYRRGTGWLGVVGSNALFAYVLPGIWHSLLVALGLAALWQKVAWPLSEAGVALALGNAFAVSLLLTGAAAALTRRGLRLRL